MINILLIDTDINYIKKLISLLSSYDNMRISAFITSENEIKNYVNKYHFDIILLDFNLKNSLEKYLLEYKDIVIFNMSKEDSKIEMYNIPCIYKTSSINELNNNIMKIIENRRNIREDIKNELKYLGYSPNYYGTKYLIDTIYILYKNDNYGEYNYNLKKIVYPVLSKKYGKKAQNIKCNIVNSTNIMICECEENKLLEYLGYFDYVKPSPKRIIEAVINKLNEKYK